MAYEVNSCDWCSKTFYAKSKRAKYCSNSCKQRSYEERKARREEAHKLTITNAEINVWNAVAEVDPAFNELLDGLFIRGEVVYLKTLLGLMMYPEINVIMWEHGLFDKLEEIGTIAQIPF